MSEWHSVKVRLIIKNNENGEVREYLSDSGSKNEGGQFDALIWEDGNYSCDCNRQLMFWRAGSDEEKDYAEQHAGAIEEQNDENGVDYLCGDGKFSLNVFDAATGECYYREMED